jgi:lipopolysaccharide transport system permease protein
VTLKTDALPRTIIQPGHRRALLNLRELWTYREVLQALIRREIKIRYAQTAAGLSWILLQPVLTTLVLSLLIGRWMKVSTADVPYPLFAYSGLMPWLYFTHVLTKSTACLMDTGLLSKVYFPRLLLPLATAIGGLIDLFVAGALLAFLMIYYRVPPGVSILLLPFCLLWSTMVAFGIGIWLSVLNLYYRDVMHALPFGTQLVFFMTPIAYSSSLVPHSWRWMYSLNPMVGVLECWRWALLGKPPDISFAQIAISLTTGTIVLVWGLVFFRRKEPLLADAGNS